MTVEATYTLEVDWDASGTFDGGSEDISSDLQNAFVARGYSNSLARVPMVGRATFTLNNSARSYSPPSQSNVRPRREVKLSMTYSGTTETLFRGFLESIDPVPGQKRSRQCVLQCVDGMALLQLYDGAIAYQKDVYADDIIDLVVTEVYTPPSTNYQAGKNHFPWSAERWAWNPSLGQASGTERYEETNAAQKILTACTSDWGRYYISKDGTSTFINRHQMPLDTSTELTLNDTMIDMSYSMAVQDIFNKVSVTCHPRSIGTVLEIVGRLSQRDAPMIEASPGARTFTIRFRDPSNPKIRIGAYYPSGFSTDDHLDFECTDDLGGEGTDETSNVTPSVSEYSDHIDVTLTNGAAHPVYVQKLNVLGYAVRAREPITMTSSDATSAGTYQSRTLAIDAALMSNPRDAELLADYLLDYYKDPQHLLQNVTFCANHNATLIAAARDLELCDRCIVTETQTGLSSYEGFIYSITHNITHGGSLHNVTLSLETAYDYGAVTPFTIDVSQLKNPSDDVLLY